MNVAAAESRRPISELCVSFPLQQEHSLTVKQTMIYDVCASTYCGERSGLSIYSDERGYRYPQE